MSAPENLVMVSFDRFKAAREGRASVPALPSTTAVVEFKPRLTEGDAAPARLGESIEGRWNSGWAIVKAMQCTEELAYWRWRMAVNFHGRGSPDAARASAGRTSAWEERVLYQHQQMLLPAPDRGALRWKRAARRMAGGSPLWESAIAADEARLAPKRRQRKGGAS